MATHGELESSDDKFNYYHFTYSERGDELPGHEHTFAHDSRIPEGSEFEIFLPDRSYIAKGPCTVTFPAGIWHRMVATKAGSQSINPMPR